MFFFKINTNSFFCNKQCFGKCLLLTSIEYEKEIDGECLLNCHKLEIIPQIHSLEIGNFNSCYYLSKVRLNDNIIEIPSCCFMNCHSLKEINIPNQCTKLGLFSFKNCISLTSIHLSSNIKEIEKGTFSHCRNLKEIVIENKNVSIGYDCFGECNNIEQICFGNESITEYPFEVNYKQKQYFKTIGIECNNLVMRKDDINQYGFDNVNDLLKDVKRIEDNCFRNNEELKEFVIPNNITQLGQFSFANCYNLTKIIIPSTITLISFHCFDECVNLKDIELPQCVQFESKCFWNCSLLKNNGIIPKEYIENIEN